MNNNQLFCFDIAIENIYFTTDFFKNINTSLFFRFLSFDSVLLKENFHSADNSNELSMLIGKSCLFDLDHSNFLSSLYHGHLIIYLCQFENSNNLLASTSISMDTAANYFQEYISSSRMELCTVYHIL